MTENNGEDHSTASNQVSTSVIDYYEASDIFQPLTPNNFLRLRSLNIDTHLEVTTGHVPVTSHNLLISWIKIHSYMEYFWSQFRSLYLLNLRTFHHSYHPKVKGSVRRAPKLNEIVLLHEPSAPRGSWRRGKIVKLDMRQALAQVLLPSLMGTKGNIVERSIRFLHPLELSPIDD